jgi:hypothetical protein
MLAMKDQLNLTDKQVARLQQIIKDAKRKAALVLTKDQKKKIPALAN